MDVHTKNTRSYNMSRIGSKNTSIELIVRKFLFNNGFRYRIHYNRIPGKPDLALVRHRIAIFVNGCYFHGHENCKLATTSETRKDFWREKITSNIIQRQKKRRISCDKINWTVLKIWECEIEPRKKYSEVRENNLKKLKINIL